MTREDVRKSKLLSLVLRHRPEMIGIELDSAGWTSVTGLLSALAAFAEPMSIDELRAIVGTSDKQRFAFDAEHTRIRANQGHSLPVKLGLSPAVPPPILYHGTARRFLKSILRDGLSKRRRHHVHLHADPETAAIVGKRRGEFAVLTIDAAGMHGQGFQFFETANNVWLTDTVPPAFIRLSAAETIGNAQT